MTKAAAAAGGGGGVPPRNWMCQWRMRSSRSSPSIDDADVAGSTPRTWPRSGLRLEAAAAAVTSFWACSLALAC